MYHSVSAPMVSLLVFFVAASVGGGFFPSAYFVNEYCWCILFSGFLCGCICRRWWSTNYLVSLGFYFFGFSFLWFSSCFCHLVVVSLPRFSSRLCLPAVLKQKPVPLYFYSPWFLFSVIFSSLLATVISYSSCLRVSVFWPWWSSEYSKGWRVSTEARGGRRATGVLQVKRHRCGGGSITFETFHHFLNICTHLKSYAPPDPPL